MADLVTCPNCNAKNRLSTPPEGQLPVCGKCASTLPWLISAADASFKEALNAPVPVLVDFWAPWCGPCRVVAPVLEDLSRTHRGKLKVVKLNIDENPATQSAYRVQSIPTLMLFKSGQPAETVVGALPKRALESKLEPHLKSS